MQTRRNEWVKQTKNYIEISHQQSDGSQKYKTTCITVLKVLSHHVINIFHLTNFAILPK